MRMSRSASSVAARARRSKDALVTLRDVLVLSKRRTRLELVCWELNVDQRLVWPVWELALKHGLLETAGRRRGHGQDDVHPQRAGPARAAEAGPEASFGPLTRPPCAARAP
jgi:hypothetical protein